MLLKRISGKLPPHLAVHIPTLGEWPACPASRSASAKYLADVCDAFQRLLD